MSYPQLDCSASAAPLGALNFQTPSKRLNPITVPTKQSLPVDIKSVCFSASFVLKLEVSIHLPSLLDRGYKVIHISDMMDSITFNHEPEHTFFPQVASVRHFSTNMKKEKREYWF